MIEFSTYREPTARKTHICDLCGNEIAIGEKYTRFSGSDGGYMFDTKLHLFCNEVIRQYCKYWEVNEYDIDSVIDWAREVACSGCEYYEDDNDFPPCEKSIFECERVRNYFQKGGVSE